jgi:hypothetical protein
MKTIKTKPGVTLGFVESDHIRFYTVFPEGASRDWNPPKIINQLSEITEEQAKELVNVVEWYYFDIYQDYMEDHMKKRPHKYDYAVDSIKSAAESLGIKPEEFDQYLVVKI